MQAKYKHKHITYAGFGDLRTNHMKSYLTSEDYNEQECSSGNIGFVKRLQTKELKSGDKIILTSGNYTDPCRFAQYVLGANKDVHLIGKNININICLIMIQI